MTPMKIVQGNQQLLTRTKKNEELEKRIKMMKKENIFIFFFYLEIFA